jgi:glycosyltransferase involved in cell wall biosynthesis
VTNDTNPRSEVAVVVPCYNAGHYLARAIESVFAQTYKDCCVYAIDDGSTDDTAAVLRAYGSRIISVQQPNAGAASARNHGIRLSSSPYVALLDADDEWLPVKLERQIQFLRNAPHIGMLYSDCSTSGTGPFAGSYFARVGTPPSGRVFEQTLLQGCHVYPSTVMLRRECLEDVGPFDETLPVGEDYNLWLRIAARWDVGVIPEVLAIRHSTPDSLSLTTNKDRAISTVIRAFEHVMESSPSLRPDQRQALRRAIAKRYSHYGSYLLANGEYRRSRQQLLQTWRYGLRDWRTIAKLGLGFLPHQIFASLQKIRRNLKVGAVREPR